MTTPIIDVCDCPYDADLWTGYLGAFAQDAPHYLRYFGPTLAKLAGVDRRELAELVERDMCEAVELLAPELAIDIDAHVGDLRAAGVRHQVIHGGPWALSNGQENANDRVAEFASRHPDVISAWGGIDLTDGEAALREIDRCASELGMCGISVAHFWTQADPDSPASHAVYHRLEQLKLPLWIHCGINIAADRPMRALGGEHLDRIASAHPNLVLIAGHGGWPWMLDMLAVAARHENVYIETSTHRPASMTSPGSGWEPIVFHASTILRRKLLFGSLPWTLGLTSSEIGDLASGLEQLGLPNHVVRSWMHDNAARLLGLADGPT